MTASPSDKQKYRLVLDAGTTGIKALVLDEQENLVAKDYQAISTARPETGRAEQDPQQILSAAVEVIRRAVSASAIPPKEFIGFAITNQRETSLIWHKKTGQPLYPAIIWEDTRTTILCEAWQKNFGEEVRQKTGLPCDPYFSAPKIHWTLDHVPEAQKARQEKQLLWGTLDSWLIWNLTEGHPHLTDQTNASRTLLFNIHDKKWDKKLLEIFNLPADILPKVKPSASHYGKLNQEIIGAELPLLAVCGDQQASMFAAGAKTGTTKVTFGTGTFIMQIIDDHFQLIDGFFTTLTPGEAKSVFALEATINKGGADVEPLLKNPQALEEFLWQLARDVDKIIKQLPIKPKEIIIDGGVTRDGILARIQPTISNLPVIEQKIFDGTALGAARLIPSK
ncbi:MAG: FGGY family carbohydrate kinase [bacterium]|nr:FGGY family carbohydrate kinase [bacterium]MDZ4344220.1 FGGY family carbohydrate kinase [Candidatus Binatia bacterium]